MIFFFIKLTHYSLSFTIRALKMAMLGSLIEPSERFLLSVLHIHQLGKASLLNFIFRWNWPKTLLRIVFCPMLIKFNLCSTLQLMLRLLFILCNWNLLIGEDGSGMGGLWFNQGTACVEGLCEWKPGNKLTEHSPIHCIPNCLFVSNRLLLGSLCTSHTLSCESYYKFGCVSTMSMRSYLPASIQYTYLILSHPI